MSIFNRFYKYREQFFLYSTAVREYLSPLVPERGVDRIAMATLNTIKPDMLSRVFDSTVGRAYSFGT